MNELLFAIAMSCAAPILENKTKFPWNSNDTWNLDTAFKNCKVYYPKSRCLKRFTKTGERDYRAICSKEI